MELKKLDSVNYFVVYSHTVETIFYLGVGEYCPHSYICIATFGRKKFPLLLEVLLTGLKIKLTGDRLTGEKKQS